MWEKLKAYGRTLEGFQDAFISFAISNILGWVGFAGLFLGGWVCLFRVGLGQFPPAPPLYLVAVVPMPELAMLLGALLIGLARLITIVERQLGILAEVEVDRIETKIRRTEAEIARLERSMSKPPSTA